jgi:hypothetical protein
MAVEVRRAPNLERRPPTPNPGTSNVELRTSNFELNPNLEPNLKLNAN